MRRNLMILMLSMTVATFAFANGGGMGGGGMGGSGGMMSGAGMMIVADDGSLLVTNMDMSGMMDGSSSTGTFDRDLVNIDVSGNERWRVSFTDGWPMMPTTDGDLVVVVLVSDLFMGDDGSGDEPDPDALAEPDADAEAEAEPEERVEQLPHNPYPEGRIETVPARDCNIFVDHRPDAVMYPA